MNQNEMLIEKFYYSFKNLNSEGMKECYHPDIHFSDPGFPNLNGEEAGAMWEMLTKLANGFELTYKDIKADEKTGSAFWEATYNIPVLGTTVVNKIKASFKFKDEKIIDHKDEFDMSKWIEMVFGDGIGPMIKDNPLVPSLIQTGVGIQLNAFIMLNPILKKLF